MTIPERVHDLLRGNRHKDFCDDCITTVLGLARRQEVAPITKALGLTVEFVRQSGSCSRCPRPRTKLVIHAI
jgi:hypothetical protein